MAKVSTLGKGQSEKYNDTVITAPDDAMPSGRSAGVEKSAGASRDEAAMVDSGGDQAGKMVKSTLTTKHDSPTSDIDAYYSFPDSSCKAVDTFTNRAEMLADRLGNRDQVRG